ncbi:MAG: tetratricopeptide repeat protein [Acidobacteria bacterium]|nr:tetratricopeptide repeat protein [Acidobacteriota bacterium]
MRISIPKRSKPTPVQQLNRDGVAAVEHHDYAKARKLFYRAYLLDPNDPFTLNNLGYMAELDGELERAQRYYGLAADLSSDAMVDRATSDSLLGKPVAKVAGNAQDRQMQLNRLNIEAIGLLMKDRAPEADLVLQKALKIDNRDPFTLNNMGFAREKEGELQQAVSYYSAAAALHSPEKVVVAVNHDWRGKPISEIAERNAGKVRKELQEANGDVTRQVTLLNLRGVSALNRNEREEARKLFQQAYRLDPQNAFTVNNMGYLAELEGDRETAEFYYAKARESEQANAKVALATRKDAEGRRMGEVAQQSDGKVQASMQAEVEARRRSGQPVELRRRDNSSVKPLEMPANDTAPVNPPKPPAE